MLYEFIPGFLLFIGDSCNSMLCEILLFYIIFLDLVDVMSLSPVKLMVLRVGLLVCEEE